MPAYGIAVTESNLELIQFLNDGVRPRIEEKKTFFVFEIVGPHEIKSKIVYEEELRGTSVHEMLFS